jgi:hypothetical protein
MLLRRKPKNRRTGRDLILDVRVSAVQRRRTWLRRLGVLLGLAFGVSIVVFTAWRGGEWALRRYVYENPVFAIHRLSIETDGVLSVEQLRAWAGVKLQENLMAIDLGRIKRDLELMPVIESVVVERVLPHTLCIRVAERQPVAQVILAQTHEGKVTGRCVYTLDPKGYFMFPVEATQRAAPTPTNATLPILTGIPLGDVRTGRRSDSPQVHAALRLIQAYEQSPMAGQVELREIDVSWPGLLQVTTEQTNTVVLALNDFAGQLRRWRLVHDYGRQAGRQLAWLDLSVANNVPARWLEASATPAPNLKTNSPASSRKKHV